MRETVAQGGLTPDALDQVGALVFLLADRDTGVATRARATLEATPRAAIEAFLASSEATPELGAACAGLGVDAEPETTPSAAVTDGTLASAPLIQNESRPQALALLPVIERIKLALRGTREQRTTLVRDPNKVVAVAVLGSPKLNPSEVEAYARMGSVQEEVLRVIGSSRHWTKHYPVAAALVSNPKTPLAIAMPLVTRLSERDLKVVARDRNVSDGVRAAARKFVLSGQARRR